MTASVLPPQPPSRIGYGGRRFRPAGESSGATGLYHQDDDLVWAEFSGPHVRTGRLVGTCAPDGRIDAAYCFVTADGTTIAGTCLSTPSRLADGRIVLTEQWRRMDGSTGVSTIEEVAG